MRVHARTAIAVFLTLLLLALFLRNADVGQVASEIRRARIELILLAALPTVATYLLRALRWQILLRPIGPTRFSNAFRTTVIGFAVTALLPGRAGEVLRPYLLARWEGLSFTASFATILLERLLDLLTVVVMFAAFLLLFDPGMAAVDPDVFGAIRLGGLVAAVAGVAAFAVAYVVAGHPDTLARAMLKAERILPARAARALSRMVQKFVHGFAVMRRPAQLVLALALSLPLWASIAATIWLGALAFHITLPYTGSFLLMTLLVVGVAVQTPGGVGGFHEAFRIGATAFYGAPNDRAIGAAIVLHAVSFLPVILAGAVFMAQAGLNLRGMRRIAMDREEEEAAADRDDTPDTADLAAGTLSPFAPRQADEKGGAG
jgi:uncharacterized protein (TIRG00374 family)